MKDRLRIGVITNTHGLRGEVKVFPTTDDNKRFKKLKNVIIQTKRGEITAQVENCKFFKNLVILKFKEFNSIDEIHGLLKADLMVKREDAVSLEDNEYFLCDMIDALVYEEGKDLDKDEFGTLKDILQTGANDVYIVQTKEGKEILLPVIPDCVKKIDVENKRVIVKIMNGLIE